MVGEDANGNISADIGRPAIGRPRFLGSRTILRRRERLAAALDAAEVITDVKRNHPYASARTGFLATTTVGGLAWVFLYPALSGERKGEQRRGGGREVGAGRSSGR